MHLKQIDNQIDCQFNNLLDKFILKRFLLKAIADKNYEFWEQNSSTFEKSESEGTWSRGDIKVRTGGHYAISDNIDALCSL